MAFAAANDLALGTSTAAQTLKRVALGILVGGVTFWLRSALWHLVRGADFRGRDVIGLTVLIPLLMVAASRDLQRRIPAGRAPHYMPVAACSGAWLFGPIYLLSHALASGAMWSPTPGGWTTQLLIFAVFPATTFSVATYDGTLGALGLSTVLLILVAAAGPPRPRSR